MRWLPPCLLLLIALPLAAQTGPSKDKEPIKKEPVKKEPAGKDLALPKGPVTVDQLKLSPESILVIVEDLKDLLSLVPKMVLIRPETLLSMEERIKALEKALKQDRKPASVCKLQGRLDGDSVALRGEFLFSTEQPGATVFLGMQGAFLTDEGELDRALAKVEAVEDGYVVRVDKPGNHQLFLNLVLPVVLKRALVGGASAERSVDLGLPGSAVTTLNIELPVGVKELRWNDIQEKRKGARWELALGKSKSLALTWKEPVALPGTAPFLLVDAQITGKIEETQVIWNADLTLEDLRGQTKEWHLAFPPGARVDVKTPGGSGFDLQAVEGKAYSHVLKLGDSGTERWVVRAEVIQTRPATGSRLPVGPFQALGAQRQQGTITIQATPDALRGQRLVFHRFGETYQRDLPRTGLNLASFQYWSLPAAKAAKGLMRSPLELEWKVERGKAETTVDHDLRLEPTPDAHVLRLKSTFKLKVVHRGVEFLDIQLPAAKPLPVGGLAVPGMPFPAGIEWLDLWNTSGAPNGVKPLDFTLEGEGTALEWLPPDSQGRARVRFLRELDGLSEVVIRGRYEAPKAPGRLRVELPRPLTSIENSVNVTVSGGAEVEFLRGKAGAETAATPHNHFVESWKGPASAVEFAWRKYQPDIAVAAVADVKVLERSANVVLRLHIPAALRAGLTAEAPLPLFIPPGVSLKAADTKKADELQLEYDVPLVDAADGTATGRRLSLPFPWPKGATRREIKVRLWSAGGTSLTLDESAASSREWADRGGELVPERDGLPSLVVFHPGPDPLLDVSVRAVDTLPMLVDRALIQVKVETDGNQEYRVRHLVRRFFVRRLRLELPQAAATSLEHILIDGVHVSWAPDSKVWNVVSLNVEPTLYPSGAVLEVKYRVAPHGPDETRGWRIALTPPRWLGDIHVPLVRWQVDLDQAGVVLPWAGDARTVFGWGLIGWLPGPVPTARGADDAWLTGQTSAEASHAVSLVVDQGRLEPLVLLHVARQVWLLICSAVVLIVGLAMLLFPLPRALVWALLSALALGALALAWFWPTLLAFFAYGCLPGMIVIALVVTGQWLVRQRYRRQVVFLPGFSRLKTGSSLSKGTPSPAREPSTVDAPAAGPSKSPSSVQGGS